MALKIARRMWLSICQHLKHKVQGCTKSCLKQALGCALAAREPPVTPPATGTRCAEASQPGKKRAQPTLIFAALEVRRI